MLDLVLAPMALTIKEFNAGDTVRVTVSFSYTVGINTTVRLLAGPYYSNIFGKHLVDPCVGRTDVPLVAASTPAQQTADVDFMLVPKSLGGIDNGTYGLRVWVEGSSSVAEQESVIIVSGNTSSSGGDMFSSMMPMLMMVMMLGMIMPMTQQMGQGAEEA
ncbi:MAG: hypothetical protein Q7J73_09475 [Dehalococcoidales bacterium]|nr:hypothetical protein [Dehalococcoidales bacterium]